MRYIGLPPEIWYTGLTGGVSSGAVISLNRWVIFTVARFCAGLLKVCCIDGVPGGHWGSVAAALDVKKPRWFPSAAVLDAIRDNIGA